MMRGVIRGTISNSELMTGGFIIREDVNMRRGRWDAIRKTGLAGSDAGMFETVQTEVGTFDSF